MLLPPKSLQQHHITKKNGEHVDNCNESGRRGGPPVRGAGYEPDVYIKAKCFYLFTNTFIDKIKQLFCHAFYQLY